MERRAPLGVAVGIVAWSAQDALVWRLIQNAQPHGTVPYALATQYQEAHQILLVAMIVAGVLWIGRRSIAWAVWYAAALWTLAYSGVADLLYYWPFSLPLPGTFPWLDDPFHFMMLFHPTTSANLLASTAIWVGVWAVAWVVIWLTSRTGRPELRRRQT